MSEYQFPSFDEETGKVNCQICGKSYLVISPKHLASHNLKYSEYKLRFPDAPLSCEEFGTASKYGKEKGIFNEGEEVIGEETFIDEEPEVEDEIDIEELLRIEKPDPVESAKRRILDHLRMYFSNIKRDYSIKEDFPDGRTIFEFITDFADPILKVDIEFPDTFWHNRDQYDDPARDYKLEERGWKIIKINSVSPTLKDIDEALVKL